MDFVTRLPASLVLMLASTWIALAHAQIDPSKPMRLLVTYAPGGASDIVSRLVAGKLAESLGQQVIVENRPGASGIIASELLTRAPADGHTIAHVNIAHGANPYLNAKLPYDTVRDFASVTLLATLPMILITHPSLPPKTAPALIALIKSRPDSSTTPRPAAAARTTWRWRSSATPPACRSRTSPTRAARRRSPLCWADRFR